MIKESEDKQMPQITLKNITKKFGETFAVDNLSLVIEDNSFITLLGPSGCGKTTTLRMIAGLETPTSGEIMIDDTIVYSSVRGINLSPDKRNVGFLFQNYALWPHMTVRKNISFGLENMKWDKDRIRERADEIMKMLKIEELADRYPNELSGGQQQRVAIARTLAPGPKVLLMDEPLSNLDAKLRMDMRTELKRLHLDTESTFVYVTHDQLEAMTLSSKICLMKLGLLQQFASPLEVYDSPANLFVADFVGSPTSNLIPVDKIQIKGKKAQLSIGANTVEFAATQELTIPNDKSLVLGIRPEYLQISEDGELEATVFSSLPSGMETIVKLKSGGMLLTSVLFGNKDFKVDEKVFLSSNSTLCSLYDRDSGEMQYQGKIKFK